MVSSRLDFNNNYLHYNNVNDESLIPTIFLFLFKIYYIFASNFRRKKFTNLRHVFLERQIVELNRSFAEAR